LEPPGVPARFRCTLDIGVAAAGVPAILNFRRTTTHHYLIVVTFNTSFPNIKPMI
jgi:hypothetical protein